MAVLQVKENDEIGIRRKKLLFEGSYLRNGWCNLLQV